MNRPDIDVQYWERMGWENYGRWRQVKAMADEHAVQNLGRLEHHNTFMTNLSLKVVNIGVSVNDGDAREMLVATREGTKISHVAFVLEQVENFLFTSPQATKEIPLGLIESYPITLRYTDGRTRVSSMADIFAEVFPEQSADLMRAIDDAKGNAIQDILNLFQGPVELIPYRRDLLPITQGQVSETGRLICYLPTRIAGINAKMIYENGSRFPDVGLVIKPLLLPPPF